MSLAALTTSPALAHDLAAATERLRASTVAVLVGAPHGRARATGPIAGHGSGVVWRADGLVVTNAHVARADHVALVLPDGRQVAARLVARDPRRDLALLQADVDGLTPAPVGDPGALRPGQVVLAFGHPLGVANALAVGIVHGVGTERGSARGSWARAGASLIRADVRLLPGNSGGPLAEATGRVVGINTMVVGGLGVAVSVREVEALVAAAGPLPRSTRSAA
ncbi:MAG TPA: trypsin-like peptidase domain-containing protein [Gemmatirosa sp.]